MNIHADMLRKAAHVLEHANWMAESEACQLSAAEIERLEAALAEKEKECQRLREALSYIAMYGGTLPSDNEMQISCNGVWCSKQARAALAKEGK